MKETCLKDKIMEWGTAHVFKCPTCSDMERRGYKDEGKYWDDFFAHKLKPIKYKLVKGWKVKK